MRILNTRKRFVPQEYKSGVKIFSLDSFLLVCIYVLFFIFTQAEMRSRCVHCKVMNEWPTASAAPLLPCGIILLFETSHLGKYYNTSIRISRDKSGVFLRVFACSVLFSFDFRPEIVVIAHSVSASNSGCSDYLSVLLYLYF